MKIPHGGLPVGYLTGAIGLLGREFGHKMLSPTENADAVMLALAEAMHNYKKLEDAPPKQKKKRRSK